jgi:geranylgeranyl diphosphate synthase type II
MKFSEYVENNKNLVYSTIVKYVPYRENGDYHTHAIMRDYIDRQGKYRRPGLVMLTGQLFGAKIEDLILPAAAMQISEDWILMQDDAEDDSELRRGKPAAQRIYGWVHAMNASNIGHIAMWRMLKDYILQVGNERGNRMFEKFYEMLDYTVEGQHIENTFIHYTKDLSKADENLYLRILDSKTCYYTVFGPLQIGAIAANQPEKVLNALKEIGTNAGIAFQIVDDILDMTGDEKVFGKKNFGDLYEGKLTPMVLHAYKNATSGEKKRMDDIYKKKRQDKTKDEIDFIVELINKYDGLEYARQNVEKYGNMAQQSMEKYKKLFPQNEYTPILMSAVEEMYMRKK